jgi:predicted regulator of Ras-like GTPase activity (Roadblock/LC7/MglB family)
MNHDEANQRPSSDMVLTKNQYLTVSDSLVQLAQKLRIIATFLVTSSGQIVTKKVQDAWRSDSILFSTLSASTFAAAKEMAKLLGEGNNFKMVLHEGEHLNVFICTVTSNYFLIVVFEKGVALGMVRLLTKRTIDQLRGDLRTGNADTDMENIFDRQFQERFGEELDRSLNEWH